MLQWLFGDWFPAAPRERTLIGSSIGARRMAAACQRDPAAAFARLGDLYANQRYSSAKPSPQDIDDVCQQLMHDFVGGHEDDILSHPHHRLHLLAVRGKRRLAAPVHRNAELRGFAGVALHNLASRRRLGHWVDRLVIDDSRADAGWLRERFGGFTTHFSKLTRANLAPALLASGTLPLLMKPVSAIAEAPPGSYWDGIIIDYHLALPYARVAGQGNGDIVLYPHFSEHIVPGWLDNVLIVAPSPQFLRTLPRGKLPDRNDFKHYGLDHDVRTRNWQQAIGEGQRLRDDFVAFAENPNLSQILSFEE
jgi:hypothetical protein